MQLLRASQHAPGQGLFGVHVPPSIKVPLKQPAGPVTVQAEVSGMQHAPVGQTVGVHAPGKKRGLGHWNIGTAVQAPVAGKSCTGPFGTTVTVTATDESSLSAVLRWSPDGTTTRTVTMSSSGGLFFALAGGTVVPFTTTGTHPLTVTVTDGRGNATTTTTSVSVSSC